jgi:hypothetical protein
MTQTWAIDNVIQAFTSGRNKARLKGDKKLRAKRHKKEQLLAKPPAKCTAIEHT